MGNYLLSPSVTASSATGSFTGSFLGSFDNADVIQINLQTASLLSHTASLNASVVASITSFKLETASLHTFTASGFQSPLSMSVGTTLSNTTNISGTPLYVHGNISASGDLSADDATITTQLNTDLKIGIDDYTSNLDLRGPITASNISSSGHISASGIESTGDIVANGFISANGFGSPTTITTSTTVPANYNVILFTSNYNQSITINVGVNYTISAGADVRLVNMSSVGNIPQTFYN